ncbi:MATE family efflux transporter [Undibacterium terreum]|uniref:MATE family efflux transporter n=1 Tax=Undibacterium terreum TaxID=1224302 RepID=A0A916UVM7_9BURK|nr:MATE family efflux transporter [Undibacterium terreum]GGC90151.1 MATE family efflux transporter [Undibacterium terreum]
MNASSEALRVSSIPAEAGFAAKPVIETPSAESIADQRKNAARAALLNGPIFPTLLKLAIPTMSVLIAQTAVNVAEAAYVGHLGSAPLAGVALVFPVFMLMTTMSNGGIGSGVGSAISRAIGAGRKQDADVLVFHALVLAVLFGLAFTAGALLLGPSLYHAMGGEGEALEAAVHYSAWLFSGAIPAWIVNLIASALRGSGNVRVPAIVTLAGAVILIPASPALIFGFGPIPRLGIAGAGIAFTAYYTVACLVLLHYMRSGKSGLLLKAGPLKSVYFKDILKVGIPSAVGTVLTNFTVIAVTAAVGLFGIHAIAGYGTAARLDYIMIPLLFGLATAVLTMVGVNMGAGDVMRAKKVAWIGGFTGAAMVEAIGLLVAVFPGIWLHMFTTDPLVLPAAETYLHIVAPFYGVFGLGLVLGFAAQGAGQGIWPLLGAVARMLVAAGIGWIAVAKFGAGMPVLAAIVATSFIATASVCVAAMFYKPLWKPTRK